jgi:hypothetical protein
VEVRSRGILSARASGFQLRRLGVAPTVETA